MLEAVPGGREREPAGGPAEPGGVRAGTPGGGERQQEQAARHLASRGRQLAGYQEAGPRAEFH